MLESIAAIANSKTILREMNRNTNQIAAHSHINVPGISERVVGGGSASHLLECSESMWVV